jgi:hypothetical protein
MWLSFFIALGIVGISILLLGIRVFFVKGGKFPNFHIDGNKALKSKGIHCSARETGKRDN